MVIHDIIFGICYPKDSRRLYAKRLKSAHSLCLGSSKASRSFLVCVEEIHRRYNLYPKVPSQKVELLNPILDEEGVAHDIVGKVVFYTQVIHPVDSRSPVPRVVNAAVALVRLAQVSYHVPVDSVSPQAEGLPSVSDLQI
jgi:hypothetical protein